MVTSSPPTSAPGTDKTGMDFRRILPEIRCQSCPSPGSEPTPRGALSSPFGRSGGMPAGAAGSFSQALPQMTASGHLVGIRRVAGQGAQHACQDFAALLVEAGVLRAGSRSRGLGTAAMIVLGGTFGAVLVTMPLATVLRAFRGLGAVFFETASAVSHGGSGLRGKLSGRYQRNRGRKGAQPQGRPGVAFGWRVDRSSALPLPIRGKSRMRQSRSYGSVRGVRGNSHPYRDIGLCRHPIQ